MKRKAVIMKYNILVLSSVTYALKSQGILSREGIGSKLERLKKEQSLHGCGYGIRVERANINRIKEILRREKIKIIEIIDY